MPHRVAGKFLTDQPALKFNKRRRFWLVSGLNMQGVAVAFQLLMKVVVAVVLGLFWLLGYAIQSFRDSKAANKTGQGKKD